MVAVALTAAAKAGLRPAEFWPLTPFEFWTWQRDAEIGRYKAALWQSWHTAVFSRQKKIPEISKMLRRIDRPETVPQTPEALKAKVKALHALFGGRLTDG